MLITPLRFRALHKVPALPGCTVRAALGEMAPDDPRAPWLDEHFREHLLDSVEAPTPSILVRENVLVVPGYDSTTPTTRGMLEELGGRAWAAITFGQLLHVLGTIDRRVWYMAYVRRGDDVFGVHAGWMEHGRQTEVRNLHLSSGPLDRPHPWAEGCHVLSK